MAAILVGVAALGYTVIALLGPSGVDDAGPHDALPAPLTTSTADHLPSPGPEGPTPSADPTAASVPSTTSTDPSASPSLDAPLGPDTTAMADRTAQAANTEARSGTARTAAVGATEPPAVHPPGREAPAAGPVGTEPTSAPTPGVATTPAHPGSPAPHSGTPTGEDQIGPPTAVGPATTTPTPVVTAPPATPPLIPPARPVQVPCSGLSLLSHSVTFINTSARSVRLEYSSMTCARNTVRVLAPGAAAAITVHTNDAYAFVDDASSVVLGAAKMSLFTDRLNIP